MKVICRSLCAVATYFTCLTTAVFAVPWELYAPSNPPTPTVEKNMPIACGGVGPADTAYKLRIKLVDDPLGIGYYHTQDTGDKTDVNGEWCADFNPPKAPSPPDWMVGDNRVEVWGAGAGGAGQAYAIVNVIEPP